MSYPILFSVEDPDAGLTSAIAGIAVVGKTVVGKVVEAWESQGLGVLSDAVKCRVYEEINGQYELMLEYPKTGRHYDEIGKDSIILVEVPREEKKQAFRVYEMEKTLRGTTEFTARHISYDLTGYPVKASSVTKYGIVNALNSLLTDAVVAPPFSFTTNKVNTNTQFRVTDIGSIRSWLGGREGSILDKFGGEWHWDNYTCELLDRRGADNGYTIRYAKNLTSLRNVINNEKTYTGVVCVYADADGNTVASDVQSTGVGNLVNIFSVDVSAEYESAPTVAQLNARAQAYIASAGLRSLDEMSITLSFVDNPDAMASVGLGDTVTIQCEDLDFTSRVVKSTWDVLLGRYVEMTVGKVVATLSDTIHSIENTADLTDTRNVLKLASSGNVLVRPLNADPDMTPQEWAAYRRPERFLFWPEHYFQVFTESISGRIVLPDTDVEEAGALMHLYRIEGSNKFVWLLSSQINNRPDIPSGRAVIEFTDIDIRGSVRDGEHEQVSMNIYGRVYLHGAFYADEVHANALHSVGNAVIDSGLTVGGTITNGQTFSDGGTIAANGSDMFALPYAWDGIILFYRNSATMGAYMVSTAESGVTTNVTRVCPIVNDANAQITGMSNVPRLLINNRDTTSPIRWKYIGTSKIG